MAIRRRTRDRRTSHPRPREGLVPKQFELPLFVGLVVVLFVLVLLTIRMR